MASYRYQAVGEDGAATQGVVEADDRRAAIEALTARGLFPSRLEAAPATPPGAGRAGAGGGDAPVVVGRIARKEITAFTREMATLIEATIPIPKALESLAEQEESAALRRVVADVASRVRRGLSLSDALTPYRKLFPPLYTSMIRVGEESGRLAPVMGDLAALLEREDETRGEVLAAVAYPAFVLVLGVITAFVLLAFVMPSLFKMLAGFAEVLPLPTRMLLAVSAFFQAHWLWILVGVAAAGGAVRAGFRHPAGARAWDRWKLKLPAVGPVFRAAALGRFARTLGTLEASGVSLLPALEIVRHTVGNRFLAARLVQVAEETRGGDSLAAPLRKVGLLPATMVQMIAVGEETGRLGAMLLKVAGIQEQIARNHARTLISLLAPVLILAVGALVGFIVISLLLPIFRMSQGLH